MAHTPAALPGWLLAELTPTLQLATVLAGTPDAAADLVADALVRDPSWTRLGPAVDPHPTLRAAVTRSALRDRTPPARVAVVLRDGEGLTTPEIATILDRPVKQVAADLATIPTGALEVEMLELRAATPPVAAVVDPYARAVTAARRRTRRHRALVGLGIAVAATATAVVVLLPMIMIRLVPPEVRQPGEWRFSHVVKPPEGWTVTQRILTETFEMTLIEGPETAGNANTCTVGVSKLDALDSRSGRSVRVGPWSGIYDERSGQNPSVTWSYAPGHVASASCQLGPRPDAGVTVQHTVLSMARALHFEDSRVRLPFELTSLPVGYRVDSVQESWHDSQVNGSVGLQPSDGGSMPSVTVGYGSPESPDRCLAATESVPAARVCLETWWSTEDAPGTAGLTGRSLDAVEDRLRLAPDLTDRSTWFDAIDLPSRSPT